MKSDKGVTLVSLAIYIVLIFIVVGILAVINANFQTGIKEINDEASYSAEYNKFNLYFLEDIKKEGNTITQIDSNFIEFSSGNKYEFKASDNAIYKTNGTEIIRITNSVVSCNFETTKQEEKPIITVAIQIIGMSEARITEYVLGYGNKNSNYEDEENYVSNKTYSLSEVIETNLLLLEGVDSSSNPVSETHVFETLRKINSIISDEIDVQNGQIKKYISIDIENDEATVLFEPQVENVTFPTSTNIVGETSYSISWNQL